MNILDIAPAAKGRPTENWNKRWGSWDRITVLRCNNCGIIYDDYTNRAKRSKRHFCSDRCYQQCKKGTANPNWKGGKIQIICEHCAGLFLVIPANRGSKYCSVKCKHEGLRIYLNQTEAHREHARRRDARIRAARRDIGSHTLSEWKDLKRRARGKCVKCKTTKRLTRDHIIPLSKGGGDEITNIQPLCHSCNAKKHNKVETLL